LYSCHNTNEGAFLITKITTEQSKAFDKHLEYWLSVGRRTETIDKPKAENAVNFLYEKILKLPKPKQYLFLDSPMACQIFLNGSQLYSQLYSQLHSQLHSQLYSQLHSQLHSQLYSQLHSQLHSQLYSQLHSQLYSQKMNFIYEASGNWTLQYYWHYYAVLNEIFPQKKKDFALFEEFIEHSKHYHKLHLSPEIAVVCDFPKTIQVNAKGELSSETGMALEYRDGYGIYALSGQTASSLLGLQLL
jgi:hypothetical protein